MRERLKHFLTRRAKFTAIFSRYGDKINYKGYHEKTILLNSVQFGRDVITDHIWFSMTKGFKALGELKEGDIIEFQARAKQYTKGYKGYKDDEFNEHPVSVDYKLSNPTNIKKIKLDKRQEGLDGRE